MSEFPKREEEVLRFWKKRGIFEKTLEKPAPKGEFVFYDGPPFATGLPHTGSLLSSVIKDVVPRYKTMRGYRVPRVWGWDCHGLPIESLVEKKLGLKTKKDILDIGVDTFNETARSMVLQYVHDWERYVDRVGRWVDFSNSYKTMDNSYIESVWWALKRLDGKKLLYEGRKVLMYCMHCETPLAKAEIAMDNTYKDVTEEAVTVKFKVKNPHKHNLPDNTYLLAWTTTTWSLVGDVALAVGKDITYAVTQKGTEHYVQAEDGGDLTGSDLVGIEYEPPYDVPALHSKKSYKVYAADFISAAEGTGIGHEAPMYGEDDFALAQKEGLPLVQMLEPNGHYNHEAPELVRGKYIKQAEKLIKEDLQSRGLLYAREMHTHSYPHCYRCGNPLIYNAVASWFINIQKVKEKMLSENEKISWFPEHLKHGRFRNIVENAPDWTISRNRFWASPLPIWKEKGGKKIIVVGSLDELLAKTKRSGNRYFLMRHGEAHSNARNTVEAGNDTGNALTPKGKQQVEGAIPEIRKENIDIIVASPLLRTRQTARSVQKALGLPDSAVMFDERVREVGFGEFDGRPMSEYRDFFGAFAERVDRAPQGGETYRALRRRVGEFLFDLERLYSGKNVLIVLHGGPSYQLFSIAQRKSIAQTMDRSGDDNFLGNAVVRELPFAPFPHNADYELDLHRPYIDKVVLTDGSGGKYERIPEVIDCWVESGSMPFAAAGYPKDKARVDPQRWWGLAPKGYPSDFIAEYIAQTRTWFYYMHAIGVLLFGKRAFKSVVSTGTILAADGSKMSKSKGNYTDPYELMERYGADALRLHLMGSVVMQGEDLNFRDEDVRESHNRVLGILWNSYRFFELYKADRDAAARPESAHVLDRWVRERLGETTRQMTDALDSYDLPAAVRQIKQFVEDYSTWYLRRSRDRVKTEGEDKQLSLAVQYEVLHTLARLVAPVMPFVAESIYHGIGGGKESVHLEEWPEARESEGALSAGMQRTRELASAGLKLREQAGLKIRQPLASFTIDAELDPELAEVLRDELNVKEIKVGSELALDTAISPELREEGVLREWVRAIQDWRKQQNLSVSDRPGLLVVTPDAAFIRKHRESLMRLTGLISLETKEGELTFERF